jgi:signal transduction histidine kinase
MSAWYVFTGILAAIYLLVSLSAKPSYALDIFGDLTQSAVLLLAVVFVSAQIFRNRGNARKFWIFMSFAAVLWFLSELEWVWYELIRRADVPDPSLGDVLLFVHPIPILAALALWPHQRHERPTTAAGSLDLLILLLWWVFLYVFVIMPWQFSAVQDVSRAGAYYSILYFCENLTVIAAAGALWLRARGTWRVVFGTLVLSGLFYALCSVLINRTIFLNTYYTGSLYDVPLVASLAFFASLGLLNTSAVSAAELQQRPAVSRSLAGTLALVSLISMPAIALLVTVFSHAPNAIADFRLRATLVVMLVMMGFVFLKQRLLNAEMLRLLEESRESFDNLKKMQDQLVNSEKLAALGQLVAGAAHEINNPLTAILGYSDLMISDSRTGERSRGIAEKIAQQARRTKRLVANMLSFAQQQPATKQWVQVNTLLNNVLQLREPDLTGKKIRVTTSLDLDLPEVWGDSNHLLQVFLHILNNAVDALQEVGGGIVTVSTSQADGFVSAGFSDTGHGVKDPSRIFDPFYTTKPVGKGTGLGLSVCYGIVQEHGGEIVYHNNESGGATFVVKLPARKEQVSSPEAVAMSAGDE